MWSTLEIWLQILHGAGCVITTSISKVQWQRQLPSSFVIYNKTIGSAVAEVSECSKMQAAREAVAENEEWGPSHITVCCDGSWSECEHASWNIIISATFFDTRKVLDIEIMSKFCIVCQINPTFEQKCNKNDEVTSGMDVACVLNIVDHSLPTWDICYTRVLVMGTAQHIKGWSQGKPMDQMYRWQC